MSVYKRGKYWIVQFNHNKNTYTQRQRGIKDITVRLWSRQFNKICRNANRLGYYTPDYEWGEWNIKDKPIRYLTDDEEQRILKELDPSAVKDPKHKKGRQAARDIFILMVDGGFRINEASVLKWSDVDFDSGVIYLYRSKVSNDDFIPMTTRLRMTLLNRRVDVNPSLSLPTPNFANYEEFSPNHLWNIM